MCVVVVDFHSRESTLWLEGAYVQVGHEFQHSSCAPCDRQNCKNVTRFYPCFALPYQAQGKAMGGTNLGGNTAKVRPI